MTSLSGCAFLRSGEEPSDPKAASHASDKAAKALDWSKRPLPAAVGPLHAVTFVDESHGWLVGWDGVILATRDGGGSWQRQESGTSRDLVEVSFVDARHGWVLGTGRESGDGLLLATSDGGETWEVRWRDRHAYRDVHLLDVVFLDRHRGWMIASGGILATEDGGHSWVEQYADGEWSPGALAFADRSHGWAVGMVGDWEDGQSLILQTSDGGREWKRGSPQLNARLWAVACLDSQHAWAAGQYSTWRTDDGGATWSGRGTQWAEYYSSGVAFTDELRGWMVSSEAGDSIFVSGDGGETWARVSAIDEYLNDVAVAADGTVWAVGDRSSPPFHRGVLVRGRPKKGEAATGGQ